MSENRSAIRLAALILSPVLCSQVLAESHEAEGETPDAPVVALLDEQATNQMHDDTTILRRVEVLEDRGLEFFDALRLWAGGAVQYDYYNFDGIYNHSGGGERREGGTMRRLEGTLRAQVYDWGEIKAQYDFDDGIFRDLYLRWVSPRTHTPVTVTLGNQKEPMGLDHLIGNKFSMAQEVSAPTHAFGRWRSRGVRLHRAFQIEPADRRLDIFDDEAAFVTTSIGVFTEDLHNGHDTDVAVTGRVTGGRQREGVGVHFGVSGSYREGDFDRISFRPEINKADRMTLARPQANTLGIAALEGAYNHGPLHVQAEAFYADYRGRIDGYGGGGYLQVGWFVTGEERDYNARWGVLASHSPAGKFSVELFSRLSHTRGDDDVQGWNDYVSITLGSSVYVGKFRGSFNLLYGESREPIDGEADGMAFNARAQYLF